MSATATAPANQKRATAPSRPAVPAPAKSARYVTVCCKIPNGVVLQCCTREEYLEEGLNGSRTRVRFTKSGPIYTVRGPAEPNGPIPRGYSRPRVTGGYALTPNIPLEFWERWLDENKDNDIVTSKMVYAETSRDRAEGVSRELVDTRSGLEPLNPDDDSRMPKPITAGVGAILPADEMADRQTPPPEAEDE